MREHEKFVNEEKDEKDHTWAAMKLKRKSSPERPSPQIISLHFHERSMHG
jgi:hypothetical protein